MSDIYVVMGTTGEYSDRSEWPVLAFGSEERAKEHVLQASSQAKEIQAMPPNEYCPPEGSNEFDKGMQMDYTGTEYYYLIVEFLP